MPTVPIALQLIAGFTIGYILFPYLCGFLSTRAERGNGVGPTILPR